MTQALTGFNQKIEALLQKRPVIMQLMRFAAIGALNTALDFILLNLITKHYGITEGTTLGMLNVLSFSAAVIQSYLWNKAWAFAESTGGLSQNLYRLVLVGGLGFLSFVAVFYGAGMHALPLYYVLVLVGFIVLQFSFWILFQLRLSNSNTYTQGSERHLFITFLVVSLIGLLINSGVVAIASSVISPYLSNYVNADITKNIAKAVATGFSLIWNFLGYKLIVFRR